MSSPAISKQCGTIFDRTGLPSQVVELKQQIEAPGFWDDHSKAEQVMKNMKGKEKLLLELTQLVNDFNDYLEMANEGDEELEGMVKNLVKRTEKNKIAIFLSGKYDGNNALVSFFAGAGGKDAQDWAEILFRMVLRFCEQQEWAVTIVDENYGEEVGLKSATLEVSGPMAYGFLKSENGVHRLVRLSPFNAGNTRETSFAKIEVIPLVEEDLSVEIPNDDLKIDVFRAGGKGGQSVNTTDSAVRITHLPTGITVQCQNERSQLQNKRNAMAILTSKLVELKELQHVEHLKDLKGTKKEVAWGNQIRSYVLHPYQMVKDHRTGVETSQVEKILNGDLMEFVEGYLRSEKKP
ncbi:MAG: peptide chain release factor 2 [bacterium]|nr:peptide chain release factor 2 [bacterium]